MAFVSFVPCMLRLAQVARIDTFPERGFQGCRIHLIAMFQSYESIYFWAAVNDGSGLQSTLDDAGRKEFRKRRMSPACSMASLRML